MKASIRKSMCVLVVSGTYRKNIFCRRTSFVLYFYYTPIKKRIIDHTSENVTAAKLGIGQVIGHDVSEVEDFCKSRGYDFYRVER